jgi:tRNA threonylcarbamoyladenosine biosynthesis protein TsaE
MTRTVTVRCATVEQTQSLASHLAAHCRPGQLVVLTGALGSGKTTFAKAYAAALGVTQPVTSPTFTLVHHYRCAPSAPVALLLHADLWRVADAAELDDLALDEPLEDGAAALVEWGERFESAAGRDHLVVAFAVVEDEVRDVTVDLRASSLGDAALEALRT